MDRLPAHAPPHRCSLLFEPFYLLNEWLVFGALLVLVEGAVLLGHRLGQAQRRSGTEGDSQFGAMLGAVLGLLALLLAFTFSLAVARFDARKQFVVEEANALGTLALRAKLLPEPARTRVPPLIVTYLEADLAFYDAGISPANLQEVELRIQRTQRALWAEAEAVAALDDRSVITGLFVQALNEVIDLHEKRLAALDNRVPGAVMAVLVAIAVFGSGLLGFGSGLGPPRDRIPVYLAGLVIVLVVMLIVDLGRPRRGLIISGQRSLERLEQALKSEAAER